MCSVGDPDHVPEMISDGISGLLRQYGGSLRTVGEFIEEDTDEDEEQSSGESEHS